MPTFIMYTLFNVFSSQSQSIIFIMINYRVKFASPLELQPNICVRNNVITIRHSLLVFHLFAHHTIFGWIFHSFTYKQYVNIMARYIMHTKLYSIYFCLNDWNKQYISTIWTQNIYARILIVYIRSVCYVYSLKLKDSSSVFISLERLPPFDLYLPGTPFLTLICIHTTLIYRFTYIYNHIIYTTHSVYLAVSAPYYLCTQWNGIYNIIEALHMGTQKKILIFKHPCNVIERKCSRFSTYITKLWCVWSCVLFVYYKTDAEVCVLRQWRP